MTAWCPEVGECKSSFKCYTNKSQRDYDASQAKKVPGYIKHSIGDWKHPHQRRQYWLHIYIR
jgi:hypothetical protein